jgi:hypothetical protein
MTESRSNSAPHQQNFSRQAARNFSPQRKLWTVGLRLGGRQTLPERYPSRPGSMDPCYEPCSDERKAR